jgi:hypothetical protein
MNTNDPVGGPPNFIGSFQASLIFDNDLLDVTSLEDPLNEFLEPFPGFTLPWGSSLYFSGVADELPTGEWAVRIARGLLTVQNPPALNENLSGESISILTAHFVAESDASGTTTIDHQMMGASATQVFKRVIGADGGLESGIDITGALPSLTIQIGSEEPCTADAGTLTIDQATVELVNETETVSATPNGDIVVPDGYAVVYVLTMGENLVIKQTAATPSFQVGMTGNYTIHTLVYDDDPESDDFLDLSVVVPDTTTGGEVAAIIEQNGLCASLDVAGAAVEVVACTDEDQDDICDVVDDCVGEFDALGVCNGDCEADLDQDGICDDVDDCVGEFDAIGVCNGNCEADVDEDGICDDVDDCVGEVDAIGVCNGNCEADVDEDGICDDVDDCVGEFDAIGVCNGDCEADENQNGICDDEEDQCLADAGSISFANGSSVVSFCVGDGEPDFVDVEFVDVPTDALPGTWVITDEALNILGTPATMADLEMEDFDLASPDEDHLIWFLSFDPEDSNVADITNAGDLEGCFELSNALTVDRSSDNCVVDDCPDFRYWLADGNSNGVDIYQVALDQGAGTADLTLLTSIDNGAHLAFNEEDNLLYIINSSNGNYWTLDQFGTLSAEVTVSYPTNISNVTI